MTAIPELTAYSGSAYLYFYSDAAVNMSGFSIRYRYDWQFRIMVTCWSQIGVLAVHWYRDG